MTILFGWVVVTAVARHVAGTWWAPSSLLALTMSVSGCGTVLIAPGYQNSTAANLILQGAVGLVVLFEAVGRSLPGARVPVTSTYVVRRWRVFLLVGYSAATLSLLATFRTVGITPADVLTPGGLAHVAQNATRTRYTEGLHFPVYYNICNAIEVAYAMTFAFVSANSRQWRWAAVVPLVAYAAGYVVATARAPILFMLILMAVSGVFGARVRSRDDRFPGLMGRRMVLAFAGGAAGVAMLFYGFQLLRFGAQSQRTSLEVWALMRKWPFGSVSGFSAWWDRDVPAEGNHVPGFYTFMGVIDQLGIEPRLPGAYQYFAHLGYADLGNIYTALRALVDDFGWVGAAAFLAGLGVAAGTALDRKVFNVGVSWAMYSGVASYCAWAWVYSFWAYTANVVAVALAPILLKLVCDESSTLERTEGTERWPIRR